MLNQGELERAVLVTGDLKGYEASLMKGFRVSNVAEQPRISPRACQPIFEMQAFASGYQRRALVVQTYDNDDSPHAPHHGVTMALASYARGDAPRVISALRTADRNCARYENPAQGWVYSDIKALPDPRLGDEAMAYSLVMEMPDDPGKSPIRTPMTFVVVRQGSTIATFYNMNAFQRNKPARVAMEIVQAQLKKLGHEDQERDVTSAAHAAHAARATHAAHRGRATEVRQYHAHTAAMTAGDGFAEPLNARA